MSRVKQTNGIGQSFPRACRMRNITPRCKMKLIAYTWWRSVHICL